MTGISASSPIPLGLVTPPVSVAERRGDERRRRQQDLVTISPQRLTDQELLEMLLRGVVPARSAGKTAAGLLERFGSLRATITAPVKKLRSVPGLSEAVIARIAHPMR